MGLRMTTIVKLVLRVEVAHGEELSGDQISGIVLKEVPRVDCSAHVALVETMGLTSKKIPITKSVQAGYQVIEISREVAG